MRSTPRTSSPRARSTARPLALATCLTGAVLLSACTSIEPAPGGSAATRSGSGGGSTADSSASSTAGSPGSAGGQSGATGSGAVTAVASGSSTDPAGSASTQPTDTGAGSGTGSGTATSGDDESGAPSNALTADSLRAEFAALTKTMKGRVALSWAPVGSTGKVQSLGAVTDIDGWSTLKVPISVATVVHEGGTLSSYLKSVMRRTITYSDNNGALTLWRSLGSRSDSAAAVQKVLRRGGDTHTQVRRVSFGLTDWAIADQAQFAAQLSCLPQSKPVLDLMGQVVTEQRWGLGKLDASTRFKGGWGPSASGYLMRQLGIITLPGGGKVGVSIATQPRSTHEAGALNLTKLARWFRAELTDADGGQCTATR